MIRKKGNADLVHKKDNKQMVSNYGFVSLLTICFKDFDKLSLEPVFEFTE